MEARAGTRHFQRFNDLASSGTVARPVPFRNIPGPSVPPNRAPAHYLPCLPNETRRSGSEPAGLITTTGPAVTEPAALHYFTYSMCGKPAQENVSPKHSAHSIHGARCGLARCRTIKRARGHVVRRRPGLASALKLPCTVFRRPTPATVKRDSP